MHTCSCTASDSSARFLAVEWPTATLPLSMPLTMLSPPLIRFAGVAVPDGAAAPPLAIGGVPVGVGVGVGPGRLAGATGADDDVLACCSWMPRRHMFVRHAIRGCRATSASHDVTCDEQKNHNRLSQG